MCHVIIAEAERRLLKAMRDWFRDSPDVARRVVMMRDAGRDMWYFTVRYTDEEHDEIAANHQAMEETVSQHQIEATMDAANKKEEMQQAAAIYAVRLDHVTMNGLEEGLLAAMAACFHDLPDEINRVKTIHDGR